MLKPLEPKVFDWYLGQINSLVESNHEPKKNLLMLLHNSLFSKWCVNINNPQCPWEGEGRCFLLFCFSQKRRQRDSESMVETGLEIWIFLFPASRSQPIPKPVVGQRSHYRMQVLLSPEGWMCPVWGTDPAKFYTLSSPTEIKAIYIV